MMGAIRAMMSFFRSPPPAPKAQMPPPIKITPERAKLIEDLERAKTDNARAGLGVVLTATRARSDESRVQHMFRGMLSELDKGTKHDD